MAHQVMSYYAPYAPAGMVRMQCLTCCDKGLPEDECIAEYAILDLSGQRTFFAAHPAPRTHDDFGSRLPQQTIDRNIDEVQSGGYDPD